MNVTNLSAKSPFLHSFKKTKAAPQNAQSSAVRALLKDAEIEQQSKADAAKAKSGTSQQAAAGKDGFPYFKRIERITNGHIPVYADAIELGGKYDYTKEDALNKKNAIKLRLDEAFYKEQGITPPIGASDISEENGISNSRDFLWTGMDVANASTKVDQLKQSIDYISSRYVALKERIVTEFVGEEREANLNRLDELMNTYKNELAQNFADAVGGVFEENGVEGVKEELYKGVLSELDKKTEQYAEFAKSNKNYADINGADEAWLSKDTAYMASELRKAMASANVSDTKNSASSETYTLEEMEKLQSFAKELASYTVFVDGESKAIIEGNENEESLGMKLAELSLKGMAFNEQYGVSDKIKAAVSKSINNFTKTAIQKEKDFMNKWSQLQIAGYENLLAMGRISAASANEHISAIKKGFTPFDEDAVYKVINEVQASYQKTGDVGKALMDGAVSAKKTYEAKAKDTDFDGIHRYDGGGGKYYWNNFFVNTDKRYYDAYIQNQSGRDCIVNSWKDFMGKISSNSSTFFNKFNFSALA